MRVSTYSAVGQRGGYGRFFAHRIGPGARAAGLHICSVSVMADRLGAAGKTHGRQAPGRRSGLRKERARIGRYRRRVGGGGWGVCIVKTRRPTPPILEARPPPAQRPA